MIRDLALALHAVIVLGLRKFVIDLTPISQLYYITNSLSKYLGQVFSKSAWSYYVIVGMKLRYSIKELDYIGISLTIFRSPFFLTIEFIDCAHVQNNDFNFVHYKRDFRVQAFQKSSFFIFSKGFK